MIRQIRIQNFMSHKDTVLDLADGLTVLVGPNNCGKSVVVEALRAVCENTTASYMIRHGEKEARVYIRTSDGHEIVWIRSKASAYYDIDDVRHDRLQGNVPDALHAALKMPPVGVEGDMKVDVHVADQKDPIFLLNAPGSRPAAFFASSSDAGRIIQMQEMHRSRKREREREKGRLDKEIADLDCTLDALQPLRAVRKQAGRADTLREEIEQGRIQAQELAIVMTELANAEEARLARESDCVPLLALEPPPQLYDSESLDRTMQGIQAAVVYLAGCRRRVDIVSGLTEPPSLFDTHALHHMIEELKSAAGHVASCHLLCQLLSGLERPPEMRDAIPLEKLIGNLDGASATAERERDVNSRLQGLREPPVVDEPAQLCSLLDLLADAIENQSTCKLRTEVLDMLEPTPALAGTTDLFTTVGDLERAQADVEDTRAQLDTVESQMWIAKQLIDEWVSENPTCPTCGAKVTVESLLGSHSHV